MADNSTSFLAGPSGQNPHHHDEVDNMVMTKAEAKAGWSAHDKLAAKQKTKVRKQHRSNKKALLRVFDVSSDDDGFTNFDGDDFNNFDGDGFTNLDDDGVTYSDYGELINSDEELFNSEEDFINSGEEFINSQA